MSFNAVENDNWNCFRRITFLLLNYQETCCPKIWKGERNMLLDTCNRPAGRIYPKAGVYRHIIVLIHYMLSMISFRPVIGLLTYSQSEQQCLAKHQCPFIEFPDLILIKSIGYQLQWQARAFQGCSATTTTTTCQTPSYLLHNTAH